MTWKAVETIPISVRASISTERAEAVRAALLSRTLPVARWVQGRAEPLASGSLVAEGSTLALLTAAHIFEHVAAGDLAVPLCRDGGWACLRSARVRVIVHPLRDLALIHIDDPPLARRLRANWMPVSRGHLNLDAAENLSARVFVVAGYPVSQVRRIEGAVHMKPVVFFTSALDAERLAYARTADRIDGEHIYTPELEGVSGALVWAIHEDEPTVDCLLRPSAVQVAFLHGRYVRTEPLRSVPSLFVRAS